jgi:hypothetical protein
LLFEVENNKLVEVPKLSLFLLSVCEKYPVLRNYRVNLFQRFYPLLVHIPHTERRMDNAQRQRFTLATIQLLRVGP